MEGKPEAKSNPIPIRVEPSTIRRLDRAARRIGSNRSSLARLGILRVLDEIDAGSIRIPSAADPAA